jgi:hypothetical protein
MRIRTAYLLDLDNLAGSGGPTKSQIEEVLRTFEARNQPGPSDQVFCAGTSVSAFWAKLSRPGYLTRSAFGEDGADRVLISIANPLFLANRFHRFVIGSGDGAFGALVKDLRTFGLLVEIMTGRGRLHHQLYQAVAPKQKGGITPRVELRLVA